MGDEDGEEEEEEEARASSRIYFDYDGTRDGDGTTEEEDEELILSLEKELYEDLREQVSNGFVLSPPPPRAPASNSYRAYPRRA